MTSARRYRPALDGLRGAAVLAIIGYHLGVPGVHGGWLGVDLFFVLSGFLICSLLLRQRLGEPPTPLRSFWAARARRLFPALALVLAAVVVLGFTLTPPSMRPVLRGDVLSTLGYVSNWRFVWGKEAYFASIANPSPLRHTWSLAVEEQFYLLFPLVLICVLRLPPRWRAGVLALGAVASSLAMAVLYDGGRHLDRVYYGTDTHSFGLLVGAAAAMLLHPAGGATAGLRGRLETAARRAAAPSLVVLVAALVAGRETWPLLYRGGLAGFSVLTVVVVVAAAAEQRSPVQAVLAWEPLRRVGVISYGLYLWHWPVLVYLDAERAGVGGWPLRVLQAALTGALALASYVLVERRVRRDGFAAILPGRPRQSLVAASLVLPVLLLGCTAMPLSSVELTAHHSNTTFAAAPYRPTWTSTRAMLVGNSVPAGLVEHFPRLRFPDLAVSASTNYGCDLLGTEKVVGGAVVPISDDCAAFEAHWSDPVRTVHPDVVVYFVTQTLLDDLRIDGHTVRRGTAAHWRFLDQRLSHLRRVALAAGAPGFDVVTLACHRLSVIGAESVRMNDDAEVRALNQHVKDWAHRHRVPVLDQYARLCSGGFHDAIDGTTLYDDDLHFTPRSAAVFWSWLAPAILRTVRDPAPTLKP
ncbi:MAG: acyltransferase family protein [Nocardioidaceae bacterium]